MFYSRVLFHMYSSSPGQLALRLARALNSSSVHDATVTRDLVLMIIMPILAVTIPVTILVLWLLRHFMRSHSHYRGQDHYGKKPDDVDVEDNMIMIQTPNNGEESDGESQTERKEAIDDEENDDENENNNEDHNPHADGEEREEQDEERDGEEEDEESEDDSSSSDEDNKVNEEQPLMEDCISPDA